MTRATFFVPVVGEGFSVVHDIDPANDAPIIVIDASDAVLEVLRAGDNLEWPDLPDDVEQMAVNRQVMNAVHAAAIERRARLVV